MLTASDYKGIGGLVVALVGLITSFLLQRDLRKVIELERKNKKYKNRLLKALNAIIISLYLTLNNASRNTSSSIPDIQQVTFVAGFLLA